MTVLFTDSFPGTTLDLTKWTIVSGAPFALAGDLVVGPGDDMRTIATFPSAEYHFLSVSFGATGSDNQCGVGFINDSGDDVFIQAITTSGQISSILVGHNVGAGGTYTHSITPTTFAGPYALLGLYIASHASHKAIGVRQYVSGAWHVIADHNVTGTFGTSYHGYVIHGGALVDQLFAGPLKVEDTIPLFTTFPDDPPPSGGRIYYTPVITGAPGQSQSRFAPPGTR